MTKKQAWMAILAAFLSVAALAIGQSYGDKDERPITYVCSYCGQQSSVPIQGAACGFSDGQNHNWIPVR